MENMIFEALLTGAIISTVLLIRNQIVYQARIRAIIATSLMASKGVKRGEEWRLHFDRFHQCGTYSAMLFDIRKWTFRQFYPDLPEN